MFYFLMMLFRDKYTTYFYICQVLFNSIIKYMPAVTQGNRAGKPVCLFDQV